MQYWGSSLPILFWIRYMYLSGYIFDFIKNVLIVLKYEHYILIWIDRSLINRSVNIFNNSWFKLKKKSDIGKLRKNVTIEKNVYWRRFNYYLLPEIISGIVIQIYNKIMQIIDYW